MTLQPIVKLELILLKQINYHLFLFLYATAKSEKLLAHCLNKICKDICHRVHNLNTNRFVNRDISKLDELNEKEKRRLYNEHIT